MIISGNKQFKPVPEGVFRAVLISIIDMGTQRGEYKGQEKHQRKVRFTWELPDVLQEEGEQAGKPYRISQTYTASLDAKAKLAQHIGAWRGRPISDEERLAGYDVTKTLGLGCQLQVVHATREGKTYANINSIMAIPKGMEAPKATVQPFLFSLDKFSDAVYGTLSEKMQQTIAASPEYQQLVAANSATYSSPARAVGQDFDDDIPF